MLQAARAVPGALVFLERNQVSQERRLPLELPGGPEALAAQGAPSCLDRLPLANLGGRGDQGVRHPPLLRSGQAGPGPPEGL